MTARKQPVDDRIRARREAIAYLLAGFVILGGLALSLSLCPGLSDQLLGSLREALPLYRGF
jgi:hypothetical protein